MQFSMLLGTQVIGCYLSKGYSGTLKFTTANESAMAWVSSGKVTSLKTSRDADIASIPSFIAMTSGEITVKSDISSTERLDYSKAMEEVVLSGKYNFLSMLPLANDMTVSKGTNDNFENLKLAAGIKKMQSLAGSGAAISSISTMMPISEFWNSFVLATSIGAVIPSYHKMLGDIVKRYQDAIDAEIKRFMGVAISHAFNAKVDQAVVDWRDFFTDPAYGAKPFEAWAKAIVISVVDTVPSTISEKMLSKVLSTLPQNDQKTISILIS